ncbi:glycoside hydrolase family 72 protein [Thermothielavioides terrestris NRRL 8126]|uniref:1,3-beta-glucanosyltransferase n=1 Tax=Thermothielavioides terrestris (strain ATCC 38088 / NRRL 8126) TaxID=578455 RepID=G2R1L7_THETT|nr:glycoside hydrolase family 72 protein [Thermothielavioides terrestris NRRL 8126]AEO66559.1 glycoside hydrolase family 72 protein [Thermothielavioides terrestris NRRL 8126]
MRSTAAVFSLLTAAAAVRAGPTASVPVRARAVEIEPITAKGNAFFKGNERFYVRGIDYQPGGASANIDPLADPKVCMPDIEKFKKLGVNVIRVYSTDNSMDHDECMNALAEANIYVVLDANNPKYSIKREDPHGSYNTVYLQSVFATIDSFAKYSNTMAFISGNEVINDQTNTTLAAPYVKATDRDMRAYIKARNYRKILVGYSAADVSSNRQQTANYFNCGPDEERSDFFAFNDYSWCSSDFITAGWDVKVRNFTGYGIPIFLTEYGCNTNKRNFGELQSLMHPNMTGVYSGGLMYEYSMEPNKYGIVEIKGGQDNGGIDQTGERIELDEFAAFASALKKWPAPSGDGGYTSTSKAAPCPTQDQNWLVSSTKLPAIPEGAKKFFESGAGKGPGLNGPGSETATDQASTSDDSTTSGSSSTSVSSTSGSGMSSTSTSASTPTKSTNAAVRARVSAVDTAPFVVSGLVLFFTLVGAAAL